MNIKIFLYWTIIICCILINLSNNNEQLNDEIIISNTNRLGNLLDAWYFGNMGSPERVKEFKLIKNKNKNNGLSSLLKINKYETTRLEKNTEIKLVDESNKFWASYSYDNIKSCLPQARKDLNKKVRKFIDRTNLNININKDTCVIHYRVGDFIKLGQLINIKSIVNACKLFNYKFKEIHILNGGKTYAVESSTESDKLLDELVNKFKDEFLNCIIKLLDNKVDYDFIYLTKAPYLVTAGGSFAVWGAIGNINGKILTPSCKNLNFPEKGKLKPLKIDNNWNTYDYDLY